MKSLILPIVLVLLGAGVGLGAGTFLGSGKAAETPAHGHDSADAGHSADHGHGDSDGQNYVEFDEQFIIPIVEDDRLRAMALMSLGLEVADADRDAVLRARPKLRDAFLQSMLEHSALGGFSGNFTDLDKLDRLRTRLNRMAKKVSENQIKEVFILEIVRQDV